MRDDDDDADSEEFVHHRGTPTGRVYVHTRCRGHTLVSGGDFTHICDPFWPCTSTYCCECEGFAPLIEVRWKDTREKVSEYRSRLRAETPALLKAWRFGAGFLIGGAFGGAGGLVVGLLAQVPQNKIVGFAAVGALVGGVVCYLSGTFILNRFFGVDYRRMR